RTGTPDDDRRDAFAQVRMRNADDRAFHHARDLVDLGLHLLRVDVVAARDDEILAAPDDMDIAAPVYLAEVTGDEEAVVAKLRTGLFRHAPVTLEYVRPPHFDHAC